MKKILLTLFTIIISSQLFAQKIEVSILANSGVFQYTGNGTASTSFINSAGGNPPQGYTNNPYGSIAGFSYGGGIQAQYAGKSGFLAGVQGGYDVLKSKVNIDRVYPLVFNFDPNYINYYDSGIPASGQTSLQSQSFNINPYIGYRIRAKTISIDLMPGIDLVFNTSTYDKGSAATTDGTIYKVDDKLPKSPTDVRLRFSAAASLRKWGITASYAHGITNYKSNMDAAAGGSSTAMTINSELIRFGITYRIL